MVNSIVTTVVESRKDNVVLSQLYFGGITRRRRSRARPRRTVGSSVLNCKVQAHFTPERYANNLNAKNKYSVVLRFFTVV